MSKSIHIPTFIKNKAEGKVLQQLIYVQVNAIYILFFLMG